MITVLWIAQQEVNRKTVTSVGIKVKWTFNTMSNLNSLNTSPDNLNDIRNEKCFKQQKTPTAVAGEVTGTLL